MEEGLIKERHNEERISERHTPIRLLPHTPEINLYLKKSASILGIDDWFFN